MKLCRSSDKETIEGQKPFHIKTQVMYSVQPPHRPGLTISSCYTHDKLFREAQATNRD